MYKPEYRVMYGEGEARQESQAYHRKSEAIKEAKRLQKQGFVNIIIDYYDNPTGFDGHKNKDDLTYITSFRI